MPRILIQLLLLLPALSAIGILPTLLQAVPEALARGNWRGAAFDLLVLPGLLALVASVLLPQGWQSRTGVRIALVTGLIMAGTACVLLALIMVIGPGGRLRPPYAPMQFALIGGPMIVAVWNLRRLAGKAFAVLAGLCALLVFVTVAWTAFGTLYGCTREYDAATGEHTACE